MSQIFPSGGQSIGVSALASVLPVNIQGWFFRIDWFDLLAVKGTLKSLLQHHSLKLSFLWHSAFFMVQLSHPYMITGKTIALTIRTFASKVMSLPFNMLSRFVTAFLPKSKHLLISWLQSLSFCSDFGAQRDKISHCFHFSLFYLPWSDGTVCHNLSFLNVEFQASFFTSSFTLIKRLFSSSSPSAIKVVLSA